MQDGRGVRGGHRRSAGSADVARVVGIVTAVLLSGPLVLSTAADASVESELAFHRGVVAYGEGRYAEAREQFERVLEEEPRDPAAIHYLGLIAQETGDAEQAVRHFRRAADLAPEDLDLRVDLASALLEVGRPQEAQEVLVRILEENADHPHAQLYAGIAAYRLGDYSTARSRLERAEALDPDLRREARYYTGLLEAHRGNYAEAAGAFDLVAEQSPLSPLGRSAGELGEQVRAARERSWALAVTAGIEWDSNPLVVGEEQSDDEDFRGVLRVAGSYSLVRSDRFELSVGYDGFASLHQEASEVDIQNHLGWVSGSVAPIEWLRLGLRYDYSHTQVDLDDDFRALHRLTPSLDVDTGRWGLAQFFYQYQTGNYFLSGEAEDLQVDPTPALDRDGQQHAVGWNHFFFVSDAVRYVRLGVLGEKFDPEGTEFEYDGIELTAAISLQLPWQVGLAADYRFMHRDYRNESFFEAGTERDDDVHRVSVELVRPLGRHLQVALAGSYLDNDSNVGTFDYDRTIIGTYLTYRF